jgi:hypothetical protein
MLDPVSQVQRWVDYYKVWRLPLADTGLPRIDGPAFVLGSAPHPTLPAGFSHAWTFVAVNASQSSSGMLGIGIPDFVVFRDRIFADRLIDREAVAALKGARARQVVFQFASDLPGVLRERLAGIGYSFDSLTILERWQRNKIIALSMGSYLEFMRTGRRTSAGIFAVALALHLGADPVVMSGFSFSTAGHAYSNSNLARRHISKDRGALLRFIQNGHRVFASDEDFARDSSIPLWRPGI